MEPQTKSPPVVIIKNDKEERNVSDSSGICCGVLAVTLVFLGAFSILVIFFIYILDRGADMGLYFFLGFSSFIYLIHLLLNCIGIYQDYKYLRYKVFTKKEFICKLSQLFQSDPKLILRATAYHESSPTINIDGFIYKDGVATVEDTFSFLSQRDISGTFRLHSTTKKIMIMKLNVKIIVPEDGTADDINKKSQEHKN